MKNSREYLAGIRSDPQRPGFKHIILYPWPTGALKSASATHRSMHGTIVSNWKIENGTFRYHVEVPVNTTAMLYMPAKDAATVREGSNPASTAPGVSYLRTENSRAIFKIDSGCYTFTAPR